jgi:hypothetical protein
MKYTFSKSIAKEIAELCHSVKVEYLYGYGRRVTLGFPFVPQDCHGEDIAYAFKDAIYNSAKRGNPYGVSVSIAAPWVENASAAVTSMNKYIGHEVVHKAGEESVVYVILEYTPVSKVEK